MIKFCRGGDNFPGRRRVGRAGGTTASPGTSSKPKSICPHRDGAKCKKVEGMDCIFRGQPPGKDNACDFR